MIKNCIVCGKEFVVVGRYPSKKYCSINCRNRLYYINRNPKYDEYKRAYYKKNRSTILIKRKIHSMKPEVRERARACYGRHKYEYNKVRRRKETLETKKIIFEHYGGKPPKCACCGETGWEFLSVDHINGGGTKHKKELNCGGGLGFYKWIINNNFPTDLRLLCMNCNFALGKFGYCPHDKK